MNTLNTQRDVASFVLRLTQDFWRDRQGEPHVQWRGRIRHVQGEAEAAFTDFAEAVGFIQQRLADVTLNAIPGGNPMEQEQVLREGFKLWQQFASSYNEMMLSAMERTLQQSEALKQQMDDAVEKSLKAWNLSGQASQGELVEAIRGLQAQVAALSEKVDRLEKKAASR